MLNQETKRRIDAARDILVGKVPDPKAQVEQITTALIYKFMDDMDTESEELGGQASFFVGDYEKFGWSKLLDPRLGGFERLNLYVEALLTMPQNPQLPQLFRNILKDAFLPYRDPETLNLFLKEINAFTYDHSEKLGDAFEYLLSVLGSQGDAGQFRTPRHIIDFIVEVLDPKKTETILDPACGTAGFLISGYKHILKQNSNGKIGDKLTPDEKTKLMSHFMGYDISPDMVRLSLTNMYLHGFQNPNIFEYDTLTSEERWDETYDVIMANPPFMSPKGGIRPHKRFSIPASRSEVLFVDYIAEHLNREGGAGIIVPEGIIFQSGGAYKALRKMLVEKYLWAVVSLPGGIFQPYSGVKTSILLMHKQLAKKADTILFVKVENDGFDLGAQRRAIEKNDLTQALAILQQYKHSLQQGEDPGTILGDSEISTIAVIAEKAKIAKNGDYNLSGERYRQAEVLGIHKWPFMTLGDVFEKINHTVDPQQMSGKVRYIGLENITSNTGHLVGTTITAAADIKSLKFQFSVDDVLYGKLRPNLNKVWHANFNGICSTDILVLRPIKTKALSSLYQYLLRSREFNQEVLKGLNGAQLPRVSYEYISQLQVPLPPLEVQQEIVAELDTYQKIIDGAKQVVENYKPTFKVDSSWELTRLENVIEFLSGLTLSIPDSVEENGTPIISMNSITRDGEITEEGIRRIKLPNKANIQYLQKCDLLFNWRNGSKDLVGKTGFFNLEGSYVFASFLLGIRPNKNVLNSRYLWILLNNYRKEGKYLQFMRQNVNGLFNREELKEVVIPLPSIEVQNQIVYKIEEELKLINANKRVIEIYELKIKDKISEIWGEDITSPTKESSRNNFVN